MSRAEVDGVPEWAITKALALMEYGGTPLATVLREPCEHYEVVAFARYIAAHEEPPVDPLLIEARKIATGLIKDGTDFSDGKKDDWYAVQCALAALRRGIQIGSGNE